ncbi:thioesterase family protein [Desulfatibacillum aliphaticivorans]|uniref:thioesterase family protein n=1 Tax=Desulfatibacillum aliphaticivorans TaxID=218208 RepID=UPI00041B330D|nr:thioesterase family protein [Desulfatibacillum aliphaticivorans]
MHRFDEDIAVSPKEGSTYAAKVTDNWSIMGIPNGGYLMALLTNAMLQQSKNENILVVTATYLSKLKPGPADLVVENFASSLNLDRYQTRLIQDGRECIRAMGTFRPSNMDRSEDRCEKQAPELAPVEQCVQVPVMPNFTLFDNMDEYLDPDSAGWMSGNLSDVSEIKGWIKFKEDRPFDHLSVLLMADSFPPPIMATKGMAGWVPTVELSVNVYEIPATPWLKCRFRTDFMSRGFLQEDGELWDENGTLIAVSRQVAQFKRAK